MKFHAERSRSSSSGTDDRLGEDKINGTDTAAAAAAEESLPRDRKWKDTLCVCGGVQNSVLSRATNEEGKKIQFFNHHPLMTMRRVLNWTTLGGWRRIEIGGKVSRKRERVLLVVCLPTDRLQRLRTMVWRWFVLSGAANLVHHRFGGEFAL